MAQVEQITVQVSPHMRAMLLSQKAHEHVRVAQQRLRKFAHLSKAVETIGQLQQMLQLLHEAEANALEARVAWETVRDIATGRES